MARDKGKERKEHPEKKSLIQDARYRLLFETSSDAIMLLDRDTFFDCNKATLDMFGLTKDEFIRRHPSEISPPIQPNGRPSRAEADKRIDEAFARGVNRFEWVHRRSNGEDFACTVWLTAFPLEGRNVLQATVRESSLQAELSMDLEAHRLKLQLLLDEKISALKKELDERVKAEAEVKRLIKAVESSFNAIALFDLEMNFIYANHAFCRLAATNQSTLKKMNVKNFLPTESIDILMEKVGRSLEGEESERFEIEVRNALGQPLWVEIAGSILLDDAAEPEGLLAIINDVTERRTAAEALISSEEKFRTLVESSMDGIVILLEGKVAYMNPALVELSGYTMQEQIGRNFEENLVPEERKRVLRAYKARMMGKVVPQIYETQFLRKDGTSIPIEVNATVMEYRGKPADFVYIRNLTERKHAIEEIRHTKERLEYALGATHTGFDIIDKDFNVIYVDPEWTKSLGDYTGKKCYEYFMGLRRPCESCAIPKAMKTRKKIISEEYLKKEDRHIEVHTIPFKTDAGEWMVGEFNIDITDRKSMLRSLEESEQMFRNLAENSPNMIFINKMGRIVYANQMCETLMGYSKKEFMSPKFDLMSIIHEDYRKMIQRNLQKHFRGEDLPPYEYKLVTKSGKILDSIINTKAIDYGSEKAILGIVTDITNFKKAEEELKRSESRYKELANGISNGLAVYQAVDGGRDFVFMDFNRAAEEIEGLKRSDLLGKRVTEVFPGIRDMGLLKVLKRVWKTGKSEHYPTSFYRDDHITGWRENFVYKLPSGEIAAVYDDVTERKKNEEMLKEKEKKYRTLMERANDAIFIADAKSGILLEVNQKAVELTGRTRKELVGMHQTLLHPPEEVKRYEKIFREHVRTGAAIQENLYVLHKSGRKIPVSISASIFELEGRTVNQGIFHDQSERIKAEESVRQADEKIQALFTSMEDLVFGFSPEGIFTSCHTPNSGKLLLPSEMFMGKSYSEVMPPHVSKFIDRGMKCNRKNKSFDFEYPLIMEGQEMWFSAKMSPVFLEGKFSGSVAVVRDITDRKRTEQALKTSTEELNALFQASTNGIGVERDGLLFFVNPSFVRMFGYANADELLGRPLVNIVSPEDRRRVKGYSKSRLASAAPPLYEFTGLRKDGSTFDAEASVSVYHIDKQVYFVGFVQDISTRKHAEKALKASELVYRSLYESTMALGDMSDLTQIMEVIAAQARNMLGGECSTIYLWNDSKGVLVPYYSNAKGDKDKFMAFEIKTGVGVTGSAIEKQEGCYANYNDPKAKKAYIPGTGRERDHLQSVIAAPMMNEGRLLGVINVIAEERVFNDDDLAKLRILAKQATIAYHHTRSMNELVNSEERFRRMGDNIHDGITIIEDGRVTYINERAAEIYGYPAEELKAMSQLDLIIPEDRQQLKQIMDNAREAGTIPGEIEFWVQAKDGSRRYVRSRTSTSREGSRTSEFIITTDLTIRKQAEDETKRKLMKYLLEDGRVYLVKEFRPAMSLEAFNDLLNLEYAGLVLSRTPKKDLARLVTGPFDHFWLGEQIEGELLFQKILASISALKGKSIVLIDRLDYLVFKFGFKETLSFIFRLRDTIYLKEQIIIVSMDTSTMKEDELNIMQKEFNEIELRQIPRPPEELFEIAKLIYERNSAGIKPSFSEIGAELSLSKPTFRKRVRNLISSGYVVEVSKGNRKVLELTQKGRSLFFK
jgi:PAS domain S-box-containing protein